MKLVTAAEMREMDRKTIEDYGVPSIVLMENAALRVVETIVERYAPFAGKKIGILCGPGNNGGDGLAIARHLATRFNANVTVWLFADPARLVGDAAANLHITEKFGLDLREQSGHVPDLLDKELAQCDLIVDALLGTGINGPVRGIIGEAIEKINASGRPVIAVDVPSGLQSDTGNVDGPCVRATVTVTFALAKIGLIDFPGGGYAGEILVADIGMPRAVIEAESVIVGATEASQIVRWLPARENQRDSNKGSFGHAMLFAGSRGYLGAAILAAEGAARTGAGLTTLAVPNSSQATVVSRISPVVMTRGLAETDGGAFASSALESALKLAARGTAAAIGPGIGGKDDPDTVKFVIDFIAGCGVPLVIDADALSILADTPDGGASVIRARMAATVLTPHPGEMETRAVQADRRAATRKATEKYNCTVLLKGARTLIASPDGRLNINTTGNPGMATGGAGDVLTGVIAALLAQGLAAHKAAAAGAFVHGLAGDLAAARNGGQTGLIATDLIDLLPRAIGQCQVTCRATHRASQ